MTPRTLNSMVVARRSGAAFARAIAARSEPGPALCRLVTAATRMGPRGCRGCGALVWAPDGAAAPDGGAAPDVAPATGAATRARLTTTANISACFQWLRVMSPDARKYALVSAMSPLRPG